MANTEPAITYVSASLRNLTNYTENWTEVAEDHIKK